MLSFDDWMKYNEEENIRTAIVVVLVEHWFILLHKIIECKRMEEIDFITYFVAENSAFIR